MTVGPCDHNQRASPRDYLCSMADATKPNSYDHAASVAGVRRYFDVLADGEWDRLEGTLAGQVSFEVHRRFLARFITTGMRVLEIGAGPGRFTIELARLGATTVVTDISRVQLDLNERYVAEAGVSGSVERRELVDICDLSRYEDDAFDAVLAYGGPLSYAFERTNAAMAEMFRVARRGAPVVASVMSTIGAYRYFLPAIAVEMESLGDDAHDRVLATGDLRETQPPGQGHTCKMFRWSEISELITSAGGRLLAASASNWASLGDADALAQIASDPKRWARFVENEVRLCAEPGIWDGSTHVIFAASTS